jgi:hypothetical protein
MTGNIKTFAAYLTISLAVLGAASAIAANSYGGQGRDQSGNGSAVYVSRGKIGGRGGGDDHGSVDAGMGEFDMVARPRTIIPGAGMAQGADGMGTRPGANMASGSSGPSSFGPDDVANFVHRGSNNGGLDLRNSAFGQVNRGRSVNAARMADANVAPEGVYNQFGFGVTAAAANSAYPYEHSLHANLPNRIDADAYNHQIAIGSYSVSGYYRSYGGSGTFENGYTPFLYYSPLYDLPHSSNYGSYSNDAAFGSGALEYRSVTTVVVQPAVYVYSHPLTISVASPQPAVADQMGTGFDAARDAFKANGSKGPARRTLPTASRPDDAGQITDPVMGLPRS